MGKRIYNAELPWALMRAPIMCLLATLVTTYAIAQTSPGALPQPHKETATAKPNIEPKAIAILKASSARLAAARAVSFTAVTSYESPSRSGPPLVYTTESEVSLRRPDKLQVITPADGPASEFYYDGKKLMAFAPAENLVAIADAPPTIDAALKVAYDTAAVYFPFADVIVADPYRDIADGLRLAFYIGQSRVVGGTTTDMLAYGNDHVFVQVWIGARDKLPRRARAVFSSDPSQLRHQVDFTNWRLNDAVTQVSFTNSRGASAKHIVFARPDPAGLNSALQAGQSKGKNESKAQNHENNSH